MKRCFSRPFRWAGLYALILALSSTLVLLDAFVIPHAETRVSALSAASATAAGTAAASAASGTTATAAGQNAASARYAAANTAADAAAGAGAAVVTANSYQDANIHITIETIRQYSTDIYIADIQVSSPGYLKTAFANNTFGRNIKAATSSIASASKAIFAVNGDYYGFRTAGFVLRNGVLYRSTPQTSASSEGLLIDSKGNFSIINEIRTSAQQLADAGAWQILTFGPALVNDGTVMVTASSEVGQSMASNPRTAIGQVSDLHYIVAVSDGRSSRSAGLSLLQLAQAMKDRGCTVAYNLDGGGSSTMWFNGRVINSPTDGRTSGERQVSDIVYIGY